MHVSEPCLPSLVPAQLPADDGLWKGAVLASWAPNRESRKREDFRFCLRRGGKDRPGVSQGHITDGQMGSDYVHDGQSHSASHFNQEFKSV